MPPVRKAIGLISLRFHGTPGDPARPGHSRPTVATHTQLSTQEVERIAHAFGLEAVRQWRSIPGGCVNSNFAVSTASGRYFLRVNEGKEEADVRYESELVEALAGAGVPTPAPLRSCDGQPFVLHRDRYVSLFPWVDGNHRALTEVSPADAAAVGAALAHMHLAGEPLADRFRRPGDYTFADIVARFEEFRGSEDAALVPAVCAIAGEIEWLEAREPIRERATRGVIHGDLFTDNVFFAGSELVALIDFEQASSGSFAYDLAVCIDAWCFRQEFVPDLVAALVAGYGAVRPLEERDLDALYVEARAAAVRFTVTRVTDAYLRPIGIPGKDFRRFLQRLQSLREAGADRFREWVGR